MMLAERTIRTGNEPVCGQAAARFAAELSRVTPFRVSIAESESDDALSTGGAVAAMRVTWTCETSWRADMETASDDGAGPAIESIIDHYTRTMAVLASNVEAARMFLELLARQPRCRTAGRADRTAARTERRYP